MTEIVARDIPDLREQLARYLLAHRRAKVNGRGMEFRCPLHDDGTASAYMGDWGWKCSGCGMHGDGRLVSLADALGLDVKLGEGRGYTLDDYARRFAFPIHKLEEWGLTTEPGRFGSDELKIPYYGLDGALVRRRIRVQKRDKKADKFWEGQGGSIAGCVYGLWMLARADAARKAANSPLLPVVFVEGESDCHALWLAGILALGLPGADSWNSVKTPAILSALAGRDVYVWEEPDQGGAQMLRGLASDFPQARVLRMDGVKDPCALRARAPETFRAQMDALMAAALPIGTPTPPYVFDRLSGDVLVRMAAEREKPLDVVPTHLPKWNGVCRGRGGGMGVAHGWYVAIGGKGGSGKSLMKDNIAAAAMQNGERVCIISLEMDQESIAERIMPIVSGVPVRELEYGQNFNRESWLHAASIMDRIQDDRGGGIWVNREVLTTLAQIRDSILYYHEYVGCRTFIIDYMQLAYVEEKGDKVHEQVQEVSRCAMKMAAEHRLAIFGLSQFTGEGNKSTTTPIPQHLYGGMPMQSDPHQIILLDHTRIRPVLEPMKVGGREVLYPTGDTDTVIVLSKNRHGPEADIPVRMHKSTTLRITEREVQEGEEW